MSEFDIFVGPMRHYGRNRLKLCLHCMREVPMGSVYGAHVKYRHPNLTLSRGYGLSNKVTGRAHKAGPVSNRTARSNQRRK